MSRRRGPPQERSTGTRSSICACRAPRAAAAPVAARRRCRGARWRRRGARSRRAADAGPRQLVCAAVQSVRQLLLAGHAPAFLMGASDQRRDHHHRYEFRLGDPPGNHRRHDETRLESERHQVRDHQPRAWRPRSGRRRIAGALQRASRDGRGRLGRDAQAPAHCRRRSTEEGHLDRSRTAESSRWAIPRSRSSPRRATHRVRCRMCSR